MAGHPPVVEPLEEPAPVLLEPDELAVEVAPPVVPLEAEVVVPVEPVEPVTVLPVVEVEVAPEPLLEAAAAEAEWVLPMPADVARPVLPTVCWWGSELGSGGG